MDPLLLAFRCLLALLLAAAGIAKLLDRAGTRQAARDFGVPEPLAGAAAGAVPVIELVAAVALLPRASARWGALAALLLLAAFTVAIGIALRRGRTPDCNCFGQLGSATVGPRTLARNLVLCAVAAVVVGSGWADPGPSATAWIGRLGGVGIVALVGGVALALVASVQARFVVHVLGQNGRLLRRIEALEAELGAQAPAAIDGRDGADGPAGLPVGEPAPDFSLRGACGEVVDRDALLKRGVPLVLVFSDPGCGPCDALLPDIARWQESSAVTLALLTRGERDENRARSEEHGLSLMLLDADRSVAKAYGAAGTPAAVIVGSDGAIASPLARGAGEVRTLASRAVAGEVRAPAAGSRYPWRLTLGERLPPMTMFDESGATMDLSRGGDTTRLVVFWNSDCPFCQDLLPELRAWDADRPVDAPELVLVTPRPGGDEVGLRAPVLLDPMGQLMSMVGAGGTPTGILIGGDGSIKSSPRVGVPGVMGLAQLNAGGKPEILQYGQGEGAVR